MSLRTGNNVIKFFFVIIFAFLFVVPAISGGSDEEGAGEKKFSPNEMIIHHISDAHEWHFFDYKGHPVAIHLPIILYSADRGLEMFSSGKLVDDHGHGVDYNGYTLEHGKLKTTEPTRQIAKLGGNEEGKTKVYSFSITKNVVSMFIAAILLLVIFFAVAAGFRKNKGKAPKGIQSFFEPLIIFVRDDIAIPNIGVKKYQKYLPYLLTVFFFIWLNNMLGLIPTGANASGNIAFTLN
jgi:F-type H+-transporting ATPase subunit a